MSSAADGDSPPELRERLESRVAALADALARRNSEALTREVARIRSEAAEHLAEQCRQLAALSRAVAEAEAGREGRLRELEEEVRTALAELQDSAPRPLDIPRRGSGDGGSVSEIWPSRDQA